MNQKVFEATLAGLIESLPEKSLTRANLLVIRGAYRVGEAEERRLASVLELYAQKALVRLRRLV